MLLILLIERSILYRVIGLVEKKVFRDSDFVV